MKSLSEILNEAIQDNEDTIITNSRIETNKKLAEKITHKFDHAKNTIDGSFYDNLGQKLEAGDIVVTINDTLSLIGCITNMQDPEDKECMLVYIPHYGEKSIKSIKSIFPFDVIKLENPIKYSK